jgi:hypothetical protein
MRVMISWSETQVSSRFKRNPGNVVLTWRLTKRLTIRTLHDFSRPSQCSKRSTSGNTIRRRRLGFECSLNNSQLPLLLALRLDILVISLSLDSPGQKEKCLKGIDLKRTEGRCVPVAAQTAARSPCIQHQGSWLLGLGDQLDLGLQVPSGWALATK